MAWRDKAERLVNLFILLLSARNFVTRAHIRETIEGYRDMGDGAFERMFERDKDELRSAGVPIITGSNDPDSDEQDGYMVRRDEFELPPVAFSAEELAVLGAANSVWQESVAARRTTGALATLRAAGVDPDPFRLQTLRPSLRAEPGFDEVMEAIGARRQVTFEYRGEPRKVQPWWLQQRSGRWFLLAFDLEREATRHFKLARITSAVKIVGRAGAFEIPPEEEIRALLRLDTSRETTSAVVAIRAGAGRDLVRDAEQLPVAEGVPEGFDVFEITRSHPEGLVSEVCALGPDAIMLEPAELRERVIAQLEVVAGGVPA